MIAKDYYEEQTDDIRVLARPVFLDDHSDEESGKYVWAYHIRIENHGQENVRLLNRHWKITDALGRTQEVRGEGVVGEQPELQPGQSFEYVSGTHLDTPSGMMVGAYEMTKANGQSLDVGIPAFSLDAEGAPRTVN